MGVYFFYQKIIKKWYSYVLETNGYDFCQFQGYLYFSNFLNFDMRYPTIPLGTLSKNNPGYLMTYLLIEKILLFTLNFHINVCFL